MSNLPVAATPPRDLSPEETKQLRARAYELERNIVQKRLLIEQTGMSLARDLCEFLDNRLWQVLDYETETAFLQSPDVNLSEGHARKLARLYREIVEERGVPLKELAGASIEKLQIALPALKDGKVGVRDVVSDAKVLGRSDMWVKYREGDPEARLAAEDEPVRKSCPTCGSYVPVEKLEGS